MSGYGWIVDVDHLAEEFLVYDVVDLVDDTSVIGTMGPRDIPDEIRDRLLLLRGDQVAHRWRCSDADGEVYYEGRYVGPGDERLFGPLEDFATPDAGATTIEYLNVETGAWEPL